MARNAQSRWLKGMVKVSKVGRLVGVLDLAWQREVLESLATLSSKQVFEALSGLSGDSLLDLD